jgi:membrane protein insertase, YidC/Oxa1 family, C-terminal domain
MKKSSKRKLLLLAGFIMIFMAACASNTGPDGNIKPEKIIYIATTFQEVFKNSWFDAFFVWPVAQLINFISQHINVVWGIGITTVIFNIITFPITLRSQENQRKMQLLQPEQDKLNKKYEGRNDERSQQAKAQELQRLYKEHDIKLSSTFLGLFIQLPVMMAMLYGAQRANAVIEGTFLGYSLKTNLGSGVASLQVFYIVVFVVAAVVQFASMKLPSYLTKQELKKDHRVKEYARPANDGGMNNDMTTNMMTVMIVVFSLSWPAAMSVYWIFSGLMNVVKTLIVQKMKVK